jgi:hypothetical protein
MNDYTIQQQKIYLRMALAEQAAIDFIRDFWPGDKDIVRDELEQIIKDAFDEYEKKCDDFEKLRDKDESERLRAAQGLQGLGDMEGKT